MQISDMIPGVNIIGRKVSTENVNATGASGSFLRLQWRVFRGRSSLRKFLDSKEHLHWLKIDLNVAGIITIENYKHKK